ncbi:penicillin acylase family protein [Thalassomonas viridans]|uniref:Penicillin acylase family protein n=1 Tax=Thalassomonas viridans TaxID=137584 RepID=A0AAF0CDJ0_9GAMM|nr:penicillin acylase family protein [Thalassomonas viridans]WDE09238.1 penicillin acylase family protein [Thalassomonas viridans]
MFSRLKERFPLGALALLWMGIPLAFLLGFLAYTLKQTLPATRLQLTVPQLLQQVTIVRDAFGVPDISASSDLAVYYGLGYAHAQDRLWQLEFKRRLGQGRLSEIFGASTLNTDRFMRTLGLARASQAALAHVSPQGMAMLQAYSDGVNALIAGQEVLPVEFYLHNTRPRPWTPADSLLQIKLMALNLSANFRDELKNQILLKHLGSDKFAQLQQVPQQAGDNRAQVPSDRQWQLAYASEQLFGQLGWDGDGLGSNAWVVSGRFSDSGGAMLAADPHLGKTLPTTFYLARLAGDKVNVRGATLPGVPVVIFGNNEHIAWGATNLAADVQDLFLEKVHDQDDSRYLKDGRWQFFSEREESIRIARDFPGPLRRKIEPVNWRVRESVHGPVISDVMPGQGEAIALRWTALDKDDTSYDAFVRLNYAKNWQQFNQALAQHVAPAMSFVYADQQNNIGIAVGGRLPLRNQGDGRFMQKGWQQGAGWPGMLEAGQLPREFNPQRGYIVTANDRWYDADYPHVISNNWQPGFRAGRIRELLGQQIARGQALRVKDFSRIQADKLSVHALKILAFVRRLQGDNDSQQEMLALLQAWDATMSPTSAAAVVYHAWLNEFTRLVVADDLATDFTFAERQPLLEKESHKSRPRFIARVVAGELGHWCDNLATPEQENCDTLALQALDHTFKQYRPLLGSSISDWQWQQAQQVRLPHVSLSDSKFFARIFDLSQGVAGGSYTVDVAGSYFEEREGYVKTVGASYRQIIDLARLAQSTFSIDAGQSGLVQSRHYDDFFELHEQFTPMPLLAPVPDGKARATGQ